MMGGFGDRSACDDFGFGIHPIWDCGFKGKEYGAYGITQKNHED
jgi:hypothetical protein